MRLIYFFVGSLFFFSCIPYRIAPRIETYKLMNSRRFLRKVPKTKGFVFIDPKEENEFREFITIKLSPKRPWESSYPYWETEPFLFTIQKDTFYLSFHEANKVNKTVNLLPLFIDESLKTKQTDPLLEDHYTSRKDYWYVVLTVWDGNKKDALNPKHPKQDKVILFLESIRKEYLNTHNYTDQIFKKKY